MSNAHVKKLVSPTARSETFRIPSKSKHGGAISKFKLRRFNWNFTETQIRGLQRVFISKMRLGVRNRGTMGHRVVKARHRAHLPVFRSTRFRKSRKLEKFDAADRPARRPPPLPGQRSSFQFRRRGWQAPPLLVRKNVTNTMQIGKKIHWNKCIKLYNKKQKNNKQLVNTSLTLSASKHSTWVSSGTIENLPKRTWTSWSTMRQFWHSPKKIKELSWFLGHKNGLKIIESTLIYSSRFQSILLAGNTKDHLNCTSKLNRLSRPCSTAR